MPKFGPYGTRLSNTRTILAYMRTALVLLGTGVSVVHLTSYKLLGWLLVLFSAILMVIGLLEFHYYDRLVDDLEKGAAA